MLNDRKITITTGRSRYEKRWRPQTLLLSELWERLRSPARGAETISEYLALPKSKQDDLKDVGGRYTFTGGSTTGGAVLYDDGKFLYSHHATDPCTGCLCPRDLCSTPCRSEQTAQGI